MATVDDSLAIIKANLAAVTPPSPAVALNAVYSYPADHASLDFETLPVGVVAQVVNIERRWQRKSKGHGRHVWQAEFVICLADGPVTDQAALAALEAQQNPWPKAIADAFLLDQQLGGTAAWIGEPGMTGDLFTYRIGHVHFLTRVFWGYRFVMNVGQTHSQTMRP